MAVAADRRRAERAARHDDGGVHVDVDDQREVQRARWVMRMQEQQRQQQQSVTPAGPGLGLGGPRRPEVHTRGGEGNEDSSQSSWDSEPLRVRDATNIVVRPEPRKRAKINKPVSSVPHTPCFLNIIA